MSYTYSFHMEQATDTARHNDRSMYNGESPSEFEPEYHGENIHWDCYDGINSKVGGSIKAEVRFYEEHFGKQLDAQNEKYRKQRHPEKCMTMDQYRKKHPGKEIILMIGDKDNHPDENKVAALAMEAQKYLERFGLKVVSVDIHYDEATPHAHIRCVPLHELDKEQGLYEVNMTGCLKDCGIKAPLDLLREDGVVDPNKGIKEFTQEDLERIREYRPDMIAEKKDGSLQFKTRSNNAQYEFTAMMREGLENYMTQKLNLDIDSVGQKRKHLSNVEWKAQKELEDQARYLEEREQQVIKEAEVKKAQMIEESQQRINDALSEPVKLDIPDLNDVPIDEGLTAADLVEIVADEHSYEPDKQKAISDVIDWFKRGVADLYNQAIAKIEAIQYGPNYDRAREVKRQEEQTLNGFNWAEWGKARHNAKDAQKDLGWEHGDDDDERGF